MDERRAGGEWGRPCWVDASARASAAGVVVALVASFLLGPRPAFAQVPNGVPLAVDAGAYPTVAPSTTYTYEVRAINNGGASPWSNPVTVRTLGVTPATPPSLSAVPVSAGEIDLAWTRGDGRETRV